MKKVVKLISILMVVIMVISLTTPVFAASATVGGQNIDIVNPTATDAAGVLKVAGKIIGFLQWIAIIGGVIIIAVLGIKYMMGSLEEKADYKKSMIQLIVGIVVVMGATSIANLIINVFK